MDLCLSLSKYFLTQCIVFYQGFFLFFVFFFTSKQLLSILIHYTKYTFQSSAQPTMNSLELLRRDLWIVSFMHLV